MKYTLIIVVILVLISCVLLFVKGTYNLNGKEEKIPLFQILLNKTIYRNAYKTYTY